MDQKHLEELLLAIQAGTVAIPEAMETLKHFPSEFLTDACIDHHRELRTGLPEVIFGESKTAEQIITIARAMLSKPGTLLATRIDQHKAEIIRDALPAITYHSQARMLSCNGASVNKDAVRGDIVVMCAGTSDIPVAEEARITAHCLGHPVTPLYDVGVAGLHRLLNKQSILTSASVIIVAAGMEGALPSVVGGLVSCPVIGVPTSVGYGAGTGGFAALLGMLNSCAPGVAVVNIDNGFGAGCMAAIINKTS